jgi:2,6-dihydroxypyridine 3-monooxygenase
MTAASTSNPLRVCIAGGSLGGLTAGLLLRDLGHDVTIHERSPVELEQRGAGIGFLPDSARYLVERLGRPIDEIGTSTDVIRYLGRDGGVVHEIAHRYHFSSWNTVYRNLLGAFGRDRYVLGSEVVGSVDDTDAVTVQFADGHGERADLLVCADGVGSTFRRALLPDARHAYAGYVAWRGMVAEAALDPAVVAALGDAITYYVYANSHILVYPIPGADGSILPGQRLINFVWYRNYLDGDDLRDVLLDRHGAQREISLPPGTARADHVDEVRATARARLPQVLAEAVCAVDDPFLQVVYDVEIERMAFGRTCLIGDAGFVARPHMAAGTAKAAANAWALAEALAAHADVPEALRAWEPGQVELGRQLVARTRRVGDQSQHLGTWDATDPDLLFRLREEGP